MTTAAAVRVRRYGSSGPPVALLHGGPGAAGYMAPVARGLADCFRILEPWQRRSGDVPLSVAGHLDDLEQLLADHFPGERPALVGSSWGAMLALCYAAAHPQQTGPLVLIGCGTFDPASRQRMRQILDQRMTPELRSRIENLESEFDDADRRLEALGRLLLPLYSHELLTTDQEVAEFDARGHQESWDDMQRLQTEGIYPSAFAAITVPVLMLHGATDPHPGTLVRDSLMPFLPQLDYRQWPRCGHYPWLERTAADDFFSTLRAWLIEHFPAA